LHQKVTALAADGGIWILMPSACAWIEAASHVIYPLPILFSIDIIPLIVSH
jgi:hypothetical protein